MNPIGYTYYLNNLVARLDLNSPVGGKVTERSIADRVGRNHDMALGVLLLTIIVAVPVLIAAVFMLVFRF